MLLPIVFIIHDFEEIIFFKSWMSKNSAYLKVKYPFLAKRLLAQFNNLSTASFAVAVLEEFVLLVAITFATLYSGCYYLWLGVFMAFFIHLIVHVVQWLVIRRYIPAIVTTLIAIPYCIYALGWLIESGMFSFLDFVVWTFLGLILVAANFMFAHWVARQFSWWESRVGGE